MKDFARTLRISGHLRRLFPQSIQSTLVPVQRKKTLKSVKLLVCNTSICRTGGDTVELISFVSCSGVTNARTLTIISKLALKKSGGGGGAIKDLAFLPRGRGCRRAGGATG